MSDETKNFSFGRKMSPSEYFWYILRKNCRILILTLIGIFSAACLFFLVLIGIELFSPKMTWETQRRIENLQKTNIVQSEEVEKLRAEIKTLRSNNESLQTELHNADQKINMLAGQVDQRDSQIEDLLDKTNFKKLEAQISSKAGWWGVFFAAFCAGVPLVLILIFYLEKKIRLFAFL